MSNFARRVLIATGILISWTLTSHAQVFRTQGTMPKYPLLMSKAVQQELKISDEQNKKIQAKIKELTPEGSFMMPPVGPAGDGESGAPKVMMSFSFKGTEGGAPPAGIVVNPDKLGAMPGLPDFKKIDEEVNKLLEQPQRDRLKQLALQREGITAVAQEDTARVLDLDDDQKDLIKQALDHQSRKMQETVQKMMADGGIQQGQLGPLYRKLREQTEKDIQTILSPEQLKKWDELTGPRFDFKSR